MENELGCEISRGEIAVRVCPRQPEGEVLLWWTREETLLQVGESDLLQFFILWCVWGSVLQPQCHQKAITLWQATDTLMLFSRLSKKCDLFQTELGFLCIASLFPPDFDLRYTRVVSWSWWCEHEKSVPGENSCSDVWVMLWSSACDEVNSLSSC